MRGEEGHLPLEAAQRPVNQRHPHQVAAVGQQVARNQAVGAVQHQVVLLRQFHNIGGGDPLHQRLHPNGGI